MVTSSFRGSCFGWPATAAAGLTLAVLVMLPQASAVRYMVGSNHGWSPNVNYTIWAQDKHFYLGDWLFFVYDRQQNNVLEVNKTNYEMCNAEHFIHNWTTGAGRDVVPLNVTRDYYFISGNGFCYGGMKIAVHVEKTPPPPSASPKKSDSPTLRPSFGGRIFIASMVAVGVTWDLFLLLW